MFLEKHFDAFMLKDIGVPYFGAGILAGLVLIVWGFAAQYKHD